MHDEYDGLDPVARKEAAIARERERLARVEQRREARGQSRFSGFIRRKWGWLGVRGDDEAIAAAVKTAEGLAVVDGLSDDVRAVLQEAAEGKPDRERLLPAARDALGRLSPDAALEVLRVLWAARIPWLTEQGMKRLEVVCSTEALLLLTGGSRAVSGGPAFSLFAAACTQGVVPVPTRHFCEVLPWAPLSVLDDLIDRGGLLPEDMPWEDRSPLDALYLRARLAPQTVSPEEAQSLHWDEYRRREAFLERKSLERRDPADLWDLLLDLTMDGDVSGISELDLLLPRREQILLRDIRSGAFNGEWPTEILRDRGLWLLMATLWKPKSLVNPHLSEFHALVALNRAYDLLKGGRTQEAVEQAERFEKGKIGLEADIGIRQEALNIRAYVAALPNTAPALAQAETLAQEAVRLGSEAQRNLALIRAWQATRKNERGSATNPFIELGLDHGSFRWEKRARDLFRRAEGDNVRQAQINVAEERIRSADVTDARFSVFFCLPLDPDRYLMPDAVPVSLVPPVPALERRTSEVTRAELDGIRARAAIELLEDLRTTPPRLDRHGSPS
ncbi:hypothetical protein AB0L85_15635 [Streptomyces sp. NPDC052051]|uniref:hypothetical protein n=1 Tax=Streptomyces sp. NPDC052051 TaxID=3154649 RepID=UPI003431DDF3